MSDDIQLLLIDSGGQGLEIGRLVQQLTWRGRKGSSSRTLSAVLIDDDGYKHARSGLDVEQGQQCIFSYRGAELFRGLIMSQSQTSKNKLTFTAYDNGVYLANNKDTFVYENKTASDIFLDVCSRFGLPVGEVAACSYKIPDLTKSKTTAFDAIADALSLDFAATGIRHYVSSSQGKLNLLTRRENILQWVIEDGQNLTAYTYGKSIEALKTRVKMLSRGGEISAQQSSGDWEGKIGIMQDIESPEENLTEAQLQDLISTVLEEKSTPERTLSVEAMGIADVQAGLGVYVIIPHLNLSRTFYVDEDVHLFKDNLHTMTLKLNFANDLTKESNEAAPAGQDYKVGDIVQFKGGYHYISSSARSPTGSKCTAGPAKITLNAKGAKHPWHLIHTDGSSRVYGWVDEGTFE